MAKGKKSSLKAALSSQQSRLKKKEEAKHAARIVEQKGQKKPQAKEIAPRTPTIPFVSSDRILLVGEGNFSYTRALAINPPESLQYLPAENITATAYDDEKECYAKYPEAEGIVAALREKGVQVLFQVDATKLDKCHALKGRRFDKIVWNFPHAGKGITDQDRNILSNQIMLLGFLRSASEYLTHGPLPQSAQLKPNKGKGKQEASDDEDEDEAGRNTTGDGAPSRGKLLITLRNVPPYTLWDLPRLAKKPPPPRSDKDPANPVYMLLRSFKFRRASWQGYEHRMTKGERVQGTGKTGQGGEDRTWEFCMAPRKKVEL